MTLTYAEKEQLRKDILKLEEHQQYNIVHLLKHHDIKYSKNASGIRFTDEQISEEVLDEIRTHVTRWLAENTNYRTISKTKN